MASSSSYWEIGKQSFDVSLAENMLGDPRAASLNHGSWAELAWQDILRFLGIALRPPNVKYSYINISKGEHVLLSAISSSFLRLVLNFT